MSGWSRWITFLLSAFVAANIVILVAWYPLGTCVTDRSCKTQSSGPPKQHRHAGVESPITMVVVTCGDRLETTMINLKSVLAFSTADIRLILFADVENIQRLQDMIQGWPAIFLERLDYELRLIRIPKRPDIFKRCDYQRMFLP
ncbi:hypothetical protein HPB47_026358, partial [Ixodes persulcatus]